ncbi:MAG: hypothetical protein HZA88_04370 [Verrucomicrobia bacterium]|nr:hypothetical protein [Verrucomicrobiota bacterium]
MKTRSILLLAALVTVPAFAGHRFACVDNGANRLLLVDQAEPARGWSVTIPAGSRDLQRLAGGRLLVSHGNGCGIYDLKDGRCLWQLEGFSGVQTARHIAACDEIMLGVIAKGAVEFHFLKRDGEWFQKSGRVVRLTDVEPGPLRLARFTDNGHVLFTTGNPIRVVEWDLTANKEVWSAPFPGKGYVALRRADGTTAVSTGGAVSVVEIARDGKITKTWLGDAYRKQYRLDWFSGFEFLPNGNVVVANWLGHGAQGKGPHVIEVDASNRVVWSWEDHAAAKQVTNLLMIDDK